MQFTIATARTTTAATTSHNPFANRNVRLWVFQGLLATLFLLAGASKLMMSSEDLTAQTWLSAGFLRFIGVCEVLGAAGLILPAIFRIRRELTSLAAAGLVVIMIGATVLTVAAGDFVPAILPLVTGLLAADVARGRRCVTFRN
ncbi:MAG: DoxX family protein [bacterium]